MKKTNIASGRISYARKALIELIEKRELRAWCMERELPHSTIYCVAIGSVIPPFTLVCKMLPYFSPAEWVYYSDEEIPYEHKTLTAFNPKDFSVFIRKHKIDYMDIAEKLSLTEANAKNIFLHRRANLSIMQIRKLSAEVNPEEFFISADDSIDGLFYPERGDVVSLGGKNILVLSTSEVSRVNKCFLGVSLEAESEKGIEVQCNKIKGFASLKGIQSFSYSRKNPVLIDKVTTETVYKVLEMVKGVLE